MKKFSDICICLLPSQHDRIAYKIALNWQYFQFPQGVRYHTLKLNGILYIRCPTALKTQIYYELPAYIQKINIWLGYNMINKIQIKLYY